MSIEDNKRPKLGHVENLPPEYLSHLAENKKLIEELEREEAVSGNKRMEGLDIELQRIKQDKDKTEREKSRFLSEIKGGLGVEIKKNPNTVTFIKRPWYYKLNKFLKNVFKKI